VLRVIEQDLMSVRSVTKELVADELESLDQPLVYRGVAKDLPLVVAGEKSVSSVSQIVRLLVACLRFWITPFRIRLLRFRTQPYAGCL